ncbi:hypothetical protein MMC31_002220 [Peltigera leucophlebia]|nr:hypothetical protein [Peltigera leucophlebia]
MAVNGLMDITMASSFFLLLLLVPATGARYVSGGAIETQAGIMPMDGVSPVSTEAPGLNGLPKELRRRLIHQTFVSSPPSNWCGMVDGDYHIPPYSPAPVYTSDSQKISAAPILPNEPRSGTKTSQYPTGTPTPPLSPNPSHQTYQQQQNTAPSWYYPPNSPISPIGPGRSDLHHQDIPGSHSELGVGEAGVNPHTGTPWNHSELRTRVHYPSPPQNYSELPGAGEARVQYPGRPTNNHSALGQ